MNFTHDYIHDHQNYKLILTVENENSINNKNTDLPFRFFEKESINCIKNWRKNAGWLKNIDIIVMCPTSDISEQTKLEYYKYNCKYINEKPKIFKEHTHGFFNVHYVGAYFEEIKELQNKCLIHIDLDMEIITEIKPHFFYDLWLTDVLAYCGAYNEQDLKNQRKPLYSSELSNTDFIVSIPAKFKFYSEMINSINYVDLDYNKYVINGNYREYDREEYSSDHLINKFNIKLIKNYEQGEGYEILNNDVFFWHEHFYDKPNYKLKLQKYKLLKELNV